MSKCDGKVEIFSRVCGFFRPIQNWNLGKRSEFQERVNYIVLPDRLIEKDK